ncbi:putative nucleotide-binding alpha-beta plait domain-containing protein [Medicago truncatula]|uniref:Putative nucleotide-binding alpha-beta plait domain-containing protein n=1 Tax=Medicago truncatula TaxID=3880 RepID=A0A396HSY8_MEDTR|nr:putative nucleotide-binding alpha-beta plait domain-containing protein [Medicago truncatula]
MIFLFYLAWNCWLGDPWPRQPELDHFHSLLWRFIVHSFHEFTYLYEQNTFNSFMNPLTLVKRIQLINSREAALNISEDASWHTKYKDSAYVFVGGIPFDFTEGDIIAVFAQYGEVVDVNLVRDASFSSSLNRVGIDVFIIDDVGDFVSALIEWFSPLHDVTIGEAVGLHRTLQWVSYIHFDNVDFVLDSQQIVDSFHTELRKTLELYLTRNILVGKEGVKIDLKDEKRFDRISFACSSYTPAKQLFVEFLCRSTCLVAPKFFLACFQSFPVLCC